MHEFNQFIHGIADRISEDLKKMQERDNVHRLGRALTQFGNEHPDIIASFRGPYKPAHHYNLHIVVPTDAIQSRSKKQTMYGFDTGTGRYFTVLIPINDIAEFLKDAQTSRRRENSGTESYLVISESFKFEEVSKQQFEEAFVSALGDIDISEARGVKEALNSFPELPHLNKDNFFGPEAPPEGPQFMGS